MNRFRDKKGWKSSFAGWMTSAVFAGGSFLLFLTGVSGTRQEAKKEEKENLQLLLDRSAAVCYALEGQYPENLSYLKDHYGIRWNEKEYLVDFEIVGVNLPPDITVIARTGGRE